jgi:hypothetical protein
VGGLIAARFGTTCDRAGVTIIEFLLARFDEEEAAVREIFDQPRVGIGKLAEPLRATKTSLLADNAAKRWQIDLAIMAGWLEGAGVVARSPQPALALLALPYSRHRDYHNEWRQ